MNTETIGNRELSAWQVAPGVTWIQTRSPLLARKLAQRTDSHLVAQSVAGDYLRTFEFPHGAAWARRLIASYTRYETPTNARELHPVLAQQAKMKPEEAKTLGIGVLVDALRRGNITQQLAAERRLAKIFDYDTGTKTSMTDNNTAPIFRP